jgi:protein TonB
MHHRRVFHWAALCAVVVVAGCATSPAPEAPPPQAAVPQVAPPPPPPVVAPAPPPARKPGPPSSAKTLDAYKKDVAKHIAKANEKAIANKLPEFLKSVIVVKMSIDQDGHPVQVDVLRSNGFDDLERKAIDSVKRAAPLPKPSSAVLAGGSTVNFVETWLFRPDGLYQIRSIAEVQDLSGGRAVVKRK